jgi:hypothetical protein
LTIRSKRWDKKYHPLQLARVEAVIGAPIMSDKISDEAELLVLLSMALNEVSDKIQ